MIRLRPRGWRAVQCAVTCTEQERQIALALSNSPTALLRPRSRPLPGVFAEPAAACSLAALQKACREGIVRAGESVVLVSTGNGLKDIASAQRAVTLEAAEAGTGARPGAAVHVAPNMGAVEEAVASLGL